MGRHVDRKFIVSLVKQFYFDRQKHYKFCSCYNCKCLDSLLNETDRWGFYDFNVYHDKWFIIFHRKTEYQITLFPVFI